MTASHEDARMRPLTRRAFSLGALASAAAAGLRARDVQAAPAEPDEGPKVLIAGDSMIAGGFGMFLERALRKTHGYDVARRGRSSSGMARPDFFNWTKEAERLVEERKPDATLLMFGGNDVQGLYMGKGEWIRWGEEGWNEEYARRVNALCDLFAPEEQQLFWVGLPIMRPEKFRRRCAHVNTIFRAEMALRKNALFIDAWDLLTNEKREYVDKMAVKTTPEATAKVVRVRAHDGIHLSGDGAGVLKRHVLTKILPILDAMS
ncbi:MAG: DUF459 domain-containing protein [Myxococcota bacterium]